jgi:hypothetical protein
MLSLLTILTLLDASRASGDTRCQLLQAVVSSRGTVESHGRTVQFGPAFAVASTARLAGRVVVEPWLKVGDTMQAFLGPDGTCREDGFRIVSELAGATEPSGKVKLTIALSDVGKGRFLLHQTARPELVPNGWYPAADPFCYYGELELKAGVWIARLTSRKTDGPRCSLKGGITWR